MLHNVVLVTMASDLGTVAAASLNDTVATTRAHVLRFAAAGVAVAKVHGGASKLELLSTRGTGQAAQDLHGGACGLAVDPDDPVVGLEVSLAEATMCGPSFGMQGTWSPFWSSWPYPTFTALAVLARRPKRARALAVVKCILIVRIGFCDFLEMLIVVGR